MPRIDESHPGFDEWVAKDYGIALPLIREASIAGNASAQCNLGQAYLMGRGVAQDTAQAAHWFERSAQGGDSGGQYWFGRCLESGKGVDQDLSEALRWYAEATEQDNRLAPYRLNAILLAQPEATLDLLERGLPVELVPAEDQMTWPEGA